MSTGAILRRTARQAGNAIDEGLKKGNKAIDTGLATATPTYTSAANASSPYNVTGQSANTMESNAYGLNGQTGSDAANAAFQSTPEYQYLQSMLGNATQEVERNSAGAGNLASGNLAVGLGNAWAPIYSNAWNNYTAGLHGLGSQGLQGAAQQSQALQALGQNQYGSGLAKSGNFTGAAGAQASNLSNLGAQLAANNQAQQAGQNSLLGAILGAGAKLGTAFLA